MISFSWPTHYQGDVTGILPVHPVYSLETYHPFHPNFTEEFIFEPRLEPGLSSATLAELNAANVQLIDAFKDFGTNSVLRVLGLDQTFRPL